MAWSYQLLAPNEQRSFRRLGALPGRFPIEAAAAVFAGPASAVTGGDDVLAAAAGLVDKSLLLRAETSVASRPLYQMLETVRAFAALELAAADERDDALAGWCATAPAKRPLPGAGLSGPKQAEWLDRVRDDLESYRGALMWLVERHRRRRSVGHRVGPEVFLADPRPRRRGSAVVSADSEPAVAAAGRRIAGSRGSGDALVHARGARSSLRRARPRARARSLRRRHGCRRAGAQSVRARRTGGRQRERRARSVRPQRRRIPRAGDPFGHRECAHRDGGDHARRRRRRAGGKPARRGDIGASTRRTVVPDVDAVRSRSPRRAARESRRRRLRSFVRVSRASASSTTSSRSCTRSARSPQRRS